MVRDLTEEDRELLFFMRNQAVSLSKLELARAVMGSKILENLKGLLNHHFFTETINLSNTARNKYIDQQLLIQFLILEIEKEPKFSGPEIMNFAGKLRIEGIPSEVEEKVSNVMTYLHDAIGEDFKEKRIHIPMLYLIALDAIEKDVKHELFHAWMLEFFNDINKEDNEYKQATGAGSARKQNIEIRINYVKNHFKNYLAR